MEHQPVLLGEVIESLAIKPGGIYVDATFGRGGHSKVILEHLDETGKLLVIDKDPEAIAAAQLWQDPRVEVRQGAFVKLREWIRELGWCGKVNGVLLDVGVSSPQLDQSERGFSFTKDGPLDMRMDPAQKLNAASWINTATAEELENVFRKYGEERFSRRVANAIVHERMQHPIITTAHLATIVSAAQPFREKHKHPATRVFQALRIFVNDELNELQQVLEQCLDVLDVKGRLLVITFHSLEDRIVKEFILRYVQGGDIPSRVPLKFDQLPVRMHRVTRAVMANTEELERNPRSRSATLRVLEKII